MCWAFRTASADVLGRVDAADADVAAAQGGRVVRSGREGAFLTRRRGVRQWSALRYGMMLPQAGSRPQLIWNARDDKLSVVPLWTRLIRQRFAVPVDAYVENAPAETWHVGRTAWMVGLFDLERDGGAVTVTEARGADRIPVLLDEADAMAWLEAEQWNAIAGMRGANRVAFAEADVFDAQSLSVDARTTVPLRRAA